MLEFASCKSKDLFRSNVGAGYWFSVLQQVKYDFKVEGRIVWVEVEGVPFKLWTKKTFKRIANNFKIAFRGKVYLIRVKDVPGWIPENMEVSDDDEQFVEDVKGGDTVVHEVGNHGEASDVDEVPEMIFDESSGQKKKQSEDPFGIYPLLDKQRKSNENVEKQNGDRDQNNNVEEPLNGRDDWRFKNSVASRTGGSILCLMEEVVKETKMKSMELITIKSCWGNYDFDYVHSDAVGNSGGILCVWDTNEFCKTNCTVSDYFVIVRGVWVKTGENILIVVVYAPHDLKDKCLLWDYLTHVSNH
nr:RNA-directed DNA polymerase, eukaryota, reverse transcriptase zinc-binding domain protein [Tanacetum cinerariifolium]